MKKTDIIVVGQGIAGSILALELMDAGKNVIVIDEPGLSNCSKVTGGIYNPVVFKRLTQSWLADRVLPVMLDYFTEMETRIGEKLLFPIKMARLFAGENEESLWRKKSVNELNEFISPDIHVPENGMGFLDANYAYVHQAGCVDASLFLEKVRGIFESKNAFVNERFDYTQLQFEGENVVYKNISAQKLIFCEGHLYKNNPWFNYIPFKPAKGELLTIYCKDLDISSIVVKDIFILPLARPHHFKVGATYNWDDLTDNITNEAKDFLTGKLKALLPFEFKVLKHEAGVRPATIDRRPVMGFHPEQRNLGIFNGLGTKGIMLSPFFAKHFCNFIENKTALWQEVDIKRFSLSKAQ